MDRTGLVAGVEHGWTVFMGFVPHVLMALLILIVGYFVAKLIAKGVSALLERAGFDRLVERGGIKRALDQTSCDASDIVAKIVFYALVLFVLELAFSVFGPNPVSQILTSIIAYLPNIFVAIIMVVLAAAIAAGVKQLVRLATATLPYGRALANASSILILVVGIFAALDQLKIAPNIVQGLFYAALAIVVGSAIVAIGGGGIQPMQAQWQKALGKVETELPRAKAEVQSASGRVQEEVQSWKRQAQEEVQEAHESESRRF